MQAREPLSRRSFIIRFAATVAAWSAGSASVLAETARALKLRYRYRSFPRGKQHCLSCVRYTRRSRVSGACSLLMTNVNYQGWCVGWTPKD